MVETAAGGCIAGDRQVNPSFRNAEKRCDVLPQRKLSIGTLVILHRPSELERDRRVGHGLD